MQSVTMPRQVRAGSALPTVARPELGMKHGSAIPAVFGDSASLLTVNAAAARLWLFTCGADERERCRVTEQGERRPGCRLGISAAGGLLGGA